jgi:NTP pyrophosphatase (non-canonical NTP hydrolase)
MGDSLFMLGTVAHQAGHEYLLTYNYHTGLFYNAVINPTNRDMLDAYMVTQSLAQELYDELDENDTFPSMAATTDILNDLYSNLETLAHWLGIDMAGALDNTIKKIEARAGL